MKMIHPDGNACIRAQQKRLNEVWQFKYGYNSECCAVRFCIARNAVSKDVESSSLSCPSSHTITPAKPCVCAQLAFCDT